MLSRRRVISIAALVAVVLGVSLACAPSRSALAENSPIPIPRTTPSHTPDPVRTTPPPFNKHAESITNPSSYWVVVDKLRPLNPRSYAPKDLVTVPVLHDNPAVMRKVAAAALVKMFAAGKAAGAGEMQIQSSYRSYAVQVRVYDGWVRELGLKQADIQSARPGFSEHQTGLAVDISPVPLKCALAACFGSTPQGKWLAANAWKYGYLLRYPADKVAITGYEYEPWHFRYIGTALSTEMHNEGVQTLEEFFGLPAAPNYAP